jgi:septum site-determining protein MinD
MLAIVGGKGGCGKTTTALGLGRALADSGRRPTVVDTDTAMPNLHTRADVPRTPGIDVIDGGAIDCVRHRSGRFSGVSVVPAGHSDSSLSRETLDRLRSLEEPILLDCPAGADEGVVGPLRATDRALVVSTATPQGLTDGIKTAALVRALGTELAGAVVTRVEADPRFDDSPFGADCPVLATVDETSGDPLATTVGRVAYDRVRRALTERNL